MSIYDLVYLIKKIMKKSILFICMFLSTYVFSQSLKGVSEEGKKVILHKDGTWEYDTNIAKENSNNISDCNYWKDEVDDFTGDVKKYTKSQVVGNSKYSRLNIELRRFNKSYLMYVTYSGDLGCVTSSSWIMFKLLNGETVKLINFGDIDCGDMNMFYSLTQENIDKLLKSPIEKIRVQGSEYYSDVEKMKLPNFFIDNFKCIKL